MTRALFQLVRSRVPHSQLLLATLLSQAALAALIAPSANAARAVDPQLLDDSVLLAAARCADAADCPAQPPIDDELLWCVSADDPRCAPLHTTGSQDGPAHARSMPSSSRVDGDDALFLAARRQQVTPRAGLCPQSGIRYRVERPPRTIERSLHAV